MSLEEQRLEEIEKILLSHKGKQKAIASNKIAKLIGIHEDDTVSTTRGLITKLIRRTELPIGACESGYYIMQTEEELNEVMQDLNGRIHGISDRIIQLTTNFGKYHGKSFRQLESEDGDI